MFDKGKKLVAVLLITGIVLAGLSLGAVNAAKPDHAERNNKKVENIIFMIPDGFSANYASNYRVYKGEEAVWDEHLKGMFTTYSADSAITDSAAAGTAMATGVKTNNGVIGLDTDGNELQTILETSKENGKSSGLVATSTITHATPASFASHVESRNNETEIAGQLLANEVDVILGGGKNNFLPASQGGNQEEVNLIEHAKDNGYQFVETQSDLLNNKDIALQKGEKLLGLFADDALAPELHRAETEEPSLAEMTGAAIDILNENKKGFFLVVEGSQIDWAGHANDAGYAMTEIQAFEKAVEEAINFAEEDGQTLVVVAGDHDTGGMTTGSNDSMDLNAGTLSDITATGDFMAAALNTDRSNVSDVVETYTGFELTNEEIQAIQDADNAALAINTVISDRANIGWTSTNHTGADIPVYAYGPQADKFSGFLDNTDLPKKMAEAMKLKLK